jgi:acetyl esterase/lipase
MAHASLLQAPEVITLWPNGAPGSEERRNEPEVRPNNYSIKNIQNPSLTVFRPAAGKANGVAVVIAPGGGFTSNVFGPEGEQPAAYFNKLGITAFVLKYRLSREPGSKVTVEVSAKEDGYRAMRAVRARAATYGVDPQKVGFIGFSAGGEVVSSVVFGDAPAVTSPDAMDAEDPRPNFAMWIYTGPVAIPREAPATMPNLPPAFLLCAFDDDSHLRPSIDILNLYRKAKVSAEMHVTSGGGHGFNLGNREKKLISVQTWPQRMTDWLIDQGFAAKE